MSHISVGLVSEIGMGMGIGFIDDISRARHDSRDCLAKCQIEMRKNFCAFDNSKENNSIFVVINDIERWRYRDDIVQDREIYLDALQLKMMIWNSMAKNQNHLILDSRVWWFHWSRRVCVRRDRVPKRSPCSNRVESNTNDPPRSLPALAVSQITNWSAFSGISILGLLIDSDSNSFTDNSFPDGYWNKDT